MIFDIIFFIMTTCLNLISGGSFLLVGVFGSLSWRLRFQKDGKILLNENRKEIESNIKKLAQNIGIEKPVELIEVNKVTTIAQAQGIGSFSGRVGIAINPGQILQLYKFERELLIAHELAHIKTNDPLWMGLIPGIAGVITTLAMTILFPSSGTYFSRNIVINSLIGSPAALVGIAVSFIVCSFFSKWREECADKLAMSICSNEAKLAAPMLFERLKQAHILHRNDPKCKGFSKLWRKLLISQNGDYIFDIFHPSYNARINYLQVKKDS